MVHLYKLNGYNIAVDSGSGSIHCLDGLAWDVIELYGSAPDGELPRLVLEKRGETPSGASVSDVLEALSDVRELISAGSLFAPDASETARAGGVSASGAFTKALCMNVSHACNMTCDYCFAGDGGYGGGERALMPFETGAAAVDFLIRSSGDARVLDVDFFGGEPLLNWDMIKRVVAYARDAQARSGKQFRFTLTTNGVLIDDDVTDFCNREIHNVVLSLDGRPEIHDSRRKLGGAGSYGVVTPKFLRFVRARGNRSYYIRGTYTGANTDFTNDILHMADLGFKELSMEPVVSAPTGRGDDGALTADDLPVLFAQYERLAREMLAREREGRGFTFYHYKLDLQNGPCIYKRVAGCGAGSEYLAVTPEGRLYPCHRFVGDPDYLMGDVYSGITNTRLREAFVSCGVNSRPECRRCWARLYCAGGCAANSYFSSGSIYGVYEFGCELFKKRLECAIMMAVERGGVTPGDRPPAS